MKTRIVMLTIHYNEDVVTDPVQWEWNDLIDANENCYASDVGYALPAEQGDLQ